jgi:hypothetical protein
MHATLPTMSDYTFRGSDGRTHKPSDSDYWQARTRELQQTVSELEKAIIDLQNRVANLDQGELHWPADTYEPPYELPQRSTGGS